MKKFLIIFTIILPLINGCTIFSPKASIEINIVGEKTSLENQVLGNYDFLGKDKTLLASVRMIPDDLTKINDEQKRAFLAYQNRIYNKDDYEKFMNMNVIGENNNGYIELINKEKIDNRSLLKYLNRLIKEENRDRKIIYNRIIKITEGINEDEIEKVEQIFAKKFRDQAQKGWLIQKGNGSWEEK